MLSENSSSNVVPCKSEFWAITCEGGKNYSQVVRQKFHITMAALDPSVTLTSSVVSVMVDTRGSQYLLCSLKPDSILQVNLDLYFDKGEKVTFSVKGHGSVHLSGYLIFNDASTLQSTVKNIDTSPLKKAISVISSNSKAESSKPASKKKSPSVEIDDDEDDLDDDLDDDDDDEEDEEEDEEFDLPEVVSKKDMQAIVKKLNIPMSDDSSEDDSDEVLDISETLQKNESKRKGILKQDKKIELSKKPSKRTFQESSDDDDNSDEWFEKEKEKIQEKKKPKKDAPSPAKNSMSAKAPQISAIKKSNIFNSPVSGAASSAVNTPVPKKSNNKQSNAANMDENSSDTDELNSSVGRTPMPQKKPLPSIQMPNDVTGSNKKKKKSKNSLNQSQSPDTSENLSLSKVKFAKKLSGGLEYEDIRVGNGPEAKKGKLIHVYYTGRLENNEIFDSLQSGSKPFSFKLGFGQVIKGWELGLEGMKVGGKRKLKIPPGLAYKNQHMSGIPPNSTLYFVVELKAVS